MIRNHVLIAILTFAALPIPDWATPASASPALPKDITRQLPAGYEPLAAASATTASQRPYYVVALQATKAGSFIRPLLVFLQDPAGAYHLSGRNDAVVFRADSGGQCDPFDPDNGLVAKDNYFTVQNGEACGDHWTDYLTFRFDPTSNQWDFHKRILENQIENLSQAPDAEALITSKHEVTAENRQHPVTLNAYRVTPR